MSKQQTAVDWLIDTMANSASMNQPEIDKVFEQAKQMERQQIIDAWLDGLQKNELQTQIAKKYYERIYGE
jgi:hypothetical protein